jgi:thiosulfate/3-mercaptopyruvate sulfurtransferase
MSRDVLVTTEWVAKNLDTPNVKLVEVDVDTTAYDEGHAPGAIAFNWTSQLQDQVRRDIITKEGLEELLGNAGIGNGDTVILYGDNNNWFAAYAFWLLEMYGHADVKLMDGGRKKWVAENRPLTKDAPQTKKVEYKAKDANAALRAKRSRVIEALGKPNITLVDVRSPAEYNGEIMAPPGLSETAQRMGHIPGAKSVPWAQAVAEDGTFKPVQELEQLYGTKGVTKDKEVIAYCRIGERSSHTWFALKHLLGYPDVRNYDGSWTEYGSLIDVPIEK